MVPSGPDNFFRKSFRIEIVTTLVLEGRVRPAVIASWSLNFLTHLIADPAIIMLPHPLNASWPRVATCG